MSVEKKKKVVFVANSPRYLVNFRSETISSFLSEGYEVFCIVLGSDEYSGTLQNLGCRFVYFGRFSDGIISNKQDALEIFRLFNFISRINPDVVLSFTTKANGLIALIRLFTRFKLLTNVSGRGNFAGQISVKGLVVTLVERVLVHASNTIFCQNDEDFLKIGKLAKGRTTTIRKINGSGVDLSKFYFTESEPKTPLRFAFFSRLLDKKGIRLFLECAEYYRNDNRIEFLVGGSIDRYGRGPSREEFDELVEAAQVHYLGDLKSSEMPEALQLCDFVVLPSQYAEGTPKILIEGLACGKIPITTNTAGCRETCASKNGLFIDSFDSDALIECVEGLLRQAPSELLSMKRNSRRLAEEKYDVKANIAIYLEEVKKLI